MEGISHYCVGIGYCADEIKGIGVDEWHDFIREVKVWQRACAHQPDGDAARTGKRSKGVNIAPVTLHVGLGTFRPVKVEDVAQHHMHTEHCIITQQTADLINHTHETGHRVIAVGTTSCRTLESMAQEDGTVRSGEMDTGIFIYPGYRFRVIDALITNFHLPESTLIMLVSAFAGRERTLAAYEEAVKERYRFFSFGDAMLIE